MRYVALCFFLLIPVFAPGQSEDWLPVTPQDLQLKDVPGNPGAAAVRLYYAHYIDHDNFSEFYYERIKILNEKAVNPNSDGKTYADVEIPVVSIAAARKFGLNLLVQMVGLKARTIHPDGSIVEFTGKPFEKTVYKGRGSRILVKAFSMPSVTVGSIVEYKYRLTYDFSIDSPTFFGVLVFPPAEWVLQSELYTVKEHLHYRPYGGGRRVSGAKPKLYFDGARVSRVTFNLKEQPTRSNGNESDMELHDVLAFEPEDYIPPENDLKPSVVFFYSSRGARSIEDEWREVGKSLYEDLEPRLSRNRGVKEAALQAIGAEADPVKKLRKLYERAQQIRNLSYERQRTPEEMKRENLQRNPGVDDALAHGYGSSEDITLLFVALARAAGFDASVGQVSDRKQRFFSREWASLEQIDNTIAVVNLNGTDIFLEPGTRFCPYGLLRWNHTATEALKLEKKGGVFVKAPPATYDKSVTRKSANLSLSQDGTLKGNVKLEFEGEEALELRLDTIDEDDAGRKKTLEGLLKEWLPAGAIVKATDTQGWENAESPLVGTFSIEAPSYASVAGKLFLVPACLFQTRENRAFTHATRKYPVYFPYSFTELDSVNIKLPAGFSVESIPHRQDASMKSARYQSDTQFNGTQLVYQRSLALNGIYFGQDKYSELKDFFGKVKTGDEQQAVLRGGMVNAQKGN
jgi:hypothetical protein